MITFVSELAFGQIPKGHMNFLYYLLRNSRKLFQEHAPVYIRLCSQNLWFYSSGTSVMKLRNFVCKDLLCLKCIILFSKIH